MAWFAIYQIEDGRLVSGTDDQKKIADADVLKARGYGVAECPDGAQAGAWNAAMLAFDPALPTPVFADPDVIIEAFTPDEWVAAKAIGDANITWWFDRLMARRQPVDVTGGTFAQGVAYLVAKGALTQERADAIAKTLGTA